MAMGSRSPGSTVIPAVRYRDARAAIRWLVDVFGFVPGLIVEGEGGTIQHAQLTLGNGMIMLGSVRPGEYGDLMRHPGELDGAVSQGPYVVVADADEVYEKALANGASALIPIRDESYGGRGFTIADPEGHVWSVGSYDPWAETL